MTRNTPNQYPANKVRPFLKWPGGKYRVLDILHQHLPDNKILVEPFVGAGSVFLNSNYSKFVLNDINQDLINLFGILQQDAQGFTVKAKKLFCARNNNRERYYELRDKFNRTKAPLLRAALFLYLNRHGYNGLCRYNLSGGYNVPFGDYRSPYFPEQELLIFAKKLSKAKLSCLSFDESIMAACKKHCAKDLVIYCDPPYAPLNQTTNFTGYAAEKFTLDDQHKLAAAAVNAKELGATIVISNHDTPFTREIYAGAKLTFFEVQRAISCKADGRDKVGELLAVFAPS